MKKVYNLENGLTLVRRNRPEELDYAYSEEAGQLEPLLMFGNREIFIGDFMRIDKEQTTFPDFIDFDGRLYLAGNAPKKADSFGQRYEPVGTDHSTFNSGLVAYLSESADSGFLCCFY